MRREAVTLYGDQFEYLADCFELIRLKSDSYTLRTEAMETERMSRYTDRTSGAGDRNHLLEIYYDLERSVAQKEESIQKKKKESERAGIGEEPRRVGSGGSPEPGRERLGHRANSYTPRHIGRG